MEKSASKLISLSNGKAIEGYSSYALEGNVMTNLLVRDLSKSGQLVLWSIRRWVQKRRQVYGFDSILQRTYELAGVPEAQKPFEEMMTLLAKVASRDVLVECPCVSFITSDELLIMHTLRSLQSKHLESAEQRIRQIMEEKLGSIFCKIGSEYVKSLSKGGFSLNQIASLSVAS